MLTDHVNMQMLGFANVGEISNEQALKGQMRAKIEEGMQKEMLSLVLNEEICRMNKEICTLKHPKATRGTEVRSILNWDWCMKTWKDSGFSTAKLPDDSISSFLVMESHILTFI